MCPQRHIDPFATNPARLNSQVNPYVDALLKADADGNLPVAFGESLRGSAGAWRHKFEAFYQRRTAASDIDVSRRRLMVEIGCHKGLTLIAMAKLFPDYDFVGIDITYKRVVMTAQRAQAAGLKNVFSILANAQSLGQLFAPSELDGLVIFFPDPWLKKKKQAKNRLLNATFATQAQAVLRPGGFLWFKTDHQPYFEAGGAALEGAGLTGIREPADPLLSYEFTSTFEKHFLEQQLPTFGAVWQRPDGVGGVLSRPNLEKTGRFLRS